MPSFGEDDELSAEEEEGQDTEDEAEAGAENVRGGWDREDETSDDGQANGN